MPLPTTSCKLSSAWAAWGGHLEGDLLDYVYFSLATYTTLGVGDLHLCGAMRLIVVVESLNGLVLIGWSASFTYLTMEELWDSEARGA